MARAERGRGDHASVVRAATRAVGGGAVKAQLAQARAQAQAQQLRRGFVLVAVLCDWQSGEPVAADDAADARWIALDEMEATLPLIRDVATLARRAARDR